MEQARYGMNEVINVARRLEAVREALGLSKAEFADRLEIDRSSYSKIELGKKPLLVKDAMRVYQLYGVDLNFLYLGQIASLPSHLSSQITSHLRGRQ